MTNLMSQFLLATVTLSAIAVGAIVLVTAVRPEHDNSAIITTIVSVCAPSLLALGALLRGQANSNEMARAKQEQDLKAEEIQKRLEETQKIQNLKGEEIKRKLEETQRLALEGQERKAEEIKATVENAKMVTKEHLMAQDSEIKEVKIGQNGLVDALVKAGVDKGFLEGVLSQQKKAAEEIEKI